MILNTTDSIISYIELLKQEENLSPEIQDYIRILEEKSERLKNMVQDVFSVSKAASGQLAVEMEEIDFGKLLRQTLADMDGEIQKSPYKFKLIYLRRRSWYMPTETGCTGYSRI